MLFLTIILAPSIYSQDKYDTGNIVTTKGDSINGYIQSKIDYELALKNNLSNKRAQLKKPGKIKI